MCLAAPRPPSPLLLLLLFLIPQASRTTHIKNHHSIPQDALSNPRPCAFPLDKAPTAKIQSSNNNTINSTQPPQSALPSQVELNLQQALSSASTSSLPSATISPKDFTVFTTDSQQSPWLPSSSPSLPAQPALNSNNSSSSSNNEFPQDFVLFDQPQRASVNRSFSSPAAAAVFGSRNSNHSRRLSSNTQSESDPSSPALQNQRVAQIIQATGHQTSSPAFTNRYHSSAQNPQQQNRLQRPPVPLFNQSAPAKNMDLNDALNFDDLAAYSGGVPTAAYPSPAASGYDMAGSSSTSSTNMGTVSPQDLFVRELASAPNSTAFTNLTSPSLYNGSPDFDSFDVSPNFGNTDFDLSGGSQDAWFPLFPQDNQIAETLAAIDASPITQTLDVEPASQSRRKSGNSPVSASHGRHSSVSGVNSRRRDKPLPPIVIDDPSDNVAMKRARNTLAARKSRERKAQKLEDLEDKIAKLEEERDHWKRIALSRGA